MALDSWCSGARIRRKVLVGGIGRRVGGIAQC
jgi:hypothetical protein